MVALIALALLALDPAFVKATVEEIGALISHEYFDPKVGAEVDAALKQSLAAGRYADAPTIRCWRRCQSRPIRDDARQAPEPRGAARRAGRARAIGAAGRGVARAGSAARQRRRARRRDSAGQRRLSRSLVLLSTRGGTRRDRGGDARCWRGTDALIIDMRVNSGGSPGTSALLVSYLLDPPGLPLFDIVHRAPLPPDHYATETVPAGGSDLTHPVFVLTRGQHRSRPPKGSRSCCRSDIARRSSARSPPARPTRGGRTA